MFFAAAKDVPVGFFTDPNDGGLPLPWPACYTPRRPAHRSKPRRPQTF
jgi:hypothetical protein